MPNSPVAYYKVDGIEGGNSKYTLSNESEIQSYCYSFYLVIWKLRIQELHELQEINIIIIISIYRSSTWCETYYAWIFLL